MNESNQYHSQNFQSAEDLHDLNKIMQAFGISNWKNLGPLESSHQDYLSLLISIDDKRYILRERPEGPQGEDIHFRYQFQQFLQQSGIPIPSFLTTPGGSR